MIHWFCMFRVMIRSRNCMHYFKIVCCNLQTAQLHKSCATSGSLFCFPCQRMSRKSCSTFKMLQHDWSLQPGNMGVVGLGRCTMTCTGWLFLSECSTSLLWQSIIVFGIELQGISPTTMCQSLKLRVASTCDLPDVINCQFREFAEAPMGPVHFLSPDQESVIHCLIICGIQLLTPNNLGETWRRICSMDIRSVSALEVLRNCTLQIDIYLVTYW